MSVTRWWTDGIMSSIIQKDSARSVPTSRRCVRLCRIVAATCRGKSLGRCKHMTLEMSALGGHGDGYIALRNFATVKNVPDRAMVHSGSQSRHGVVNVQSHYNSATCMISE